MISIIIPVYNTLQYLCRCLDSVLKQSYTDWEAVVVDDGSTDGSAEICDQYAAKDARIRVFHKANEGNVAARQFGLQRAQGDYIIQFDSDDWVEPNMLEILYQKALSTGVDMVICDYYINTTRSQVKCINKFTNINDTSQILRDCINGDVPSYVWNKLVKAECYKSNDIVFPLHLWYGEDTILNIQLLSLPIRVAYTPRCLYHYRKNSGSLLHRDPALVMGKLNEKTIWMRDFLGENYERELTFLTYQELVLSFRYGLVSGKEVCKSPLPFSRKMIQMKMNGLRLNLCLVFLILGMYPVGNVLRKILFR